MDQRPDTVTGSRELPAWRPVTPARPSAAARMAGRCTGAILLLLVLVPMGLTAVCLWPEISYPIPSLNDDATHFLLIQRASEALATGGNPIDHWVPDLEFGFPWFLYYQHVPHLTVILLHRLLLRQVDLLNVFNLVRYVLLVGFPLAVYWAMRRMRFSRCASAVGAAAAGLISADGRFGFEYASYTWAGSGMYTQLWAMPLSFITLACLERLIAKGRGYVAATAALSLLALTHLLYAYMMAISAVLLVLVGLRRDNAVRRIARLGVVAGLVAIITCYMSVPFLLGKAYLSASPYLQRWKYDSYGAANILKALVTGDLLDYRRLPVLTALLALGLAGALLTRRRPARIALALFVAWLLLYFGRPTWGRLLDVLPLHDGLLMHRFSGSVHLAAILLIGLGADWLWRQLTPVPPRWRGAVVGLLVLALLVPALRERRAAYAVDGYLIERTWHALERDADARAVLSALRDLPPGRAHAGLRGTTGNNLRIGDLHFYDLLVFHRIVTASAPYTGASLNADLMWHFDDRNAAQYDLLDVRYVVARRDWTPPVFLRPLKATGRYVLYEAQAHGYAEFARAATASAPPSQQTLIEGNRDWFLGPDPAARRFVRRDFPPATGHGRAAADGTGELLPGCPGGGRTSDQSVSPGRLDLRVECPERATLVIKITYHPNWRVSVDGRPVETFMISPSFIGLVVPAGAHEVRAEYRSPPYRTGLLIVGLAVLGAVLAGGRRFERLDARFLAGSPPRG